MDQPNPNHQVLYSPNDPHNPHNRRVLVKKNYQPMMFPMNGPNCYMAQQQQFMQYMNSPAQPMYNMGMPQNNYHYPNHMSLPAFSSQFDNSHGYMGLQNHQYCSNGMMQSNWNYDSYKILPETPPPDYSYNSYGEIYNPPQTLPAQIFQNEPVVYEELKEVVVKDEGQAEQYQLLNVGTPAEIKVAVQATEIPLESLNPPPQIIEQKSPDEPTVEKPKYQIVVPPVQATETVEIDINTVKNQHEELVKMAQFKCEICHTFYYKRCYLVQHQNAHHNQDRIHKCLKCGKKFKTEAQRDTHQQRHSGEKKYKCQKCPKSFNHQSDCNRHYFVHLEVKPFRCSTCTKGFARKDHLAKHLESHEKKKVKKRLLNPRYLELGLGEKYVEEFN
jgi:hypothetical protein